MNHATIATQLPFTRPSRSPTPSEGTATSQPLLTRRVPRPVLRSRRPRGDRTNHDLVLADAASVFAARSGVPRRQSGARRKALRTPRRPPPRNSARTHARSARRILPLVLPVRLEGIGHRTDGRAASAVRTRREAGPRARGLVPRAADVAAEVPRRTRARRLGSFQARPRRGVWPSRPLAATCHASNFIRFASSVATRRTRRERSRTLSLHLGASTGSTVRGRCPRRCRGTALDSRCADGPQPRRPRPNWVRRPRTLPHLPH